MVKLLKIAKPRRWLLMMGMAAGICLPGPAVAQDSNSPFIGVIRYFAFNFAPRQWASCDGQLLAIGQNDALFSLIGTVYGGDGQTTFALPDLRGRLPVHQGTGPGLSPRLLGQKGGAESVTLSGSQIGHRHGVRGSTAAGNQSSPTGHTLAQDGTDITYNTEVPDVQMHPGAISSATTPAAGAQPHDNMPPFLGVYCNIAMFGVYPSRQ